MLNNPLELLLAHLELRSPLPQSDREAVLALPYALKSLAPGSYAVREGEPPSGCGVLVSGFAYRQKLTGDGGRQILSIHIPGEALRYSRNIPQRRRPQRADATRGHLASSRARTFRGLPGTSTAISHAILVSTWYEAQSSASGSSTSAGATRRSGWRTSCASSPVRLDANGLTDQMGYHWPMTRPELADALGLTPVLEPGDPRSNRMG